MVALVLGALLGALYGKVYTPWSSSDPNYAHGFFVPIFTLYLVWRQRAVPRTLPPTGRVLGIPLTLVGLAALYLGDLGELPDAQLACRHPCGAGPVSSGR